MRITKRITHNPIAFLFSFLFLNYGCRPEVIIPIIADFDLIVVDSNYSVPVKIDLINKSKGALFYKWSFSDGDSKGSELRNPATLLVSKPGLVTIKLEVWNDYEKTEKVAQIEVDSVTIADFEANPQINNFAPVNWDFKFTGQGTSAFKWLFEGGSPDFSYESNPENIRYTIPGSYRVVLIATNARGKTDTVQKTILVQPPLEASFEIIPSFEDDDLEVPVKAQLANKTYNATQHNWTCDGAVINQAADSLPWIQFNNPGTYTIVYTATNQKQTQVVRKTIQVKPNSRLREFKNIHLGINTAHKETGSFFSTYLRKVILKDSVNAMNGPMIDLCFFGLNKDFSFNKFVSPVDVQNWTFSAIPGATATTLINNQEKCNCSVSLTASEFDLISNGNYFDNFSIPQITEGTLEFDRSSTPRIILFRNAAGKKGAIKLKEFVDMGEDSYIICDIKVQKD